MIINQLNIRKTNPSKDMEASQRGASDSVANFTVLSNPEMFPIWDFVVEIFARKSLLNMGRVLSIFSC